MVTVTFEQSTFSSYYFVSFDGFYTGTGKLCVQGQDFNVQGARHTIEVDGPGAQKLLNEILSAPGTTVLMECA